MPSLRKKKRMWHLLWREDGRQHAPAVSRSKELAEEALRDLRERLQRQKAGLRPGDPMWDQWAYDYLVHLEAREAAGDIRLSTLTRARQAFSHLETWLRENRPELKRLSQLTRSVMETYRLQRARKSRSRTVNTEMALLSPAFKIAVRDEVLRRSPLDGLSRLKERDSKPRVRITVDQGGRLLEAASDEFRPYLIGVLYTGARRGELWATRWEDVDLDARLIWLQNIKTHTDSSDRMRPVPIPGPLLKDLRRRRKRSPSPWPYVPEQTFRRWLLKTSKRANLAHITSFHSLRGAFASELVRLGTHRKHIQDLLGHTRSETTDRYLGAQVEDLQLATRKLSFSRQRAKPRKVKRSRGSRR